MITALLGVGLAALLIWGWDNNPKAQYFHNEGHVFGTYYNIRYEATVSFFPHRDEEDYAVSYDAYFSKVLYDAKGRRSKKREEALMQEFQQHIDELAQEANGTVYWEKPLREARRD